MTQRSSLAASLPPNLLQRIISFRARLSDGSEELVLEAVDHVGALSRGAGGGGLRGRDALVYDCKGLDSTHTSQLRVPPLLLCMCGAWRSASPGGQR